MSWSKVAFGAVKCAKGVVEHEAALTSALKGGITGLNRHNLCCCYCRFCDILAYKTQTRMRCATFSLCALGSIHVYL